CVAGRSQAGPEDLWPVIYMAQDRAAQDEARDVLQQELDRSESAMFTEAAKKASVGAAARAQELRSYGMKLLDTKPALQVGEVWEVWLVKAESLLTQIDAGFAPDMIPEDLAAVRAGLAAQAVASVPIETAEK
ncbi:MAG: AAA family ATPase, partial [Pseudomonadota bacterium]